MSNDRKNMSFSELIDNLRVMNSRSMEKTAKKSNRLNKVSNVWRNIDIMGDGPGVLVGIFAAIIIVIVTLGKLSPISSMIRDKIFPLFDDLSSVHSYYSLIAHKNVLDISLSFAESFLSTFPIPIVGYVGGIILGVIEMIIFVVAEFVVNIGGCFLTLTSSYFISNGISRSINNILDSLREKYEKSSTFEKQADKNLDFALQACDELVNNKLKNKRFSKHDLERFYKLLGDHEIETLVHLLFNDQLIDFEGKSVEERNQIEEKLGLGKTISGVDENYSVSESKNEQSNISKSSNVPNVEQNVTQNTISHDNNRVIHRRVERLYPDSSNMTLSNNEGNIIKRRRSAKYYRVESDNYEDVMQETNEEQISSGRRR